MYAGKQLLPLKLKERLSWQILCHLQKRSTASFHRIVRLDKTHLFRRYTILPMKNHKKDLATIVACLLLAPAITVIWALKFMKMKNELRLPQREMYE